MKLQYLSLEQTPCLPNNGRQGYFLKRKSKQKEKGFAPIQCYEAPIFITQTDTLSAKQRQAGLFFEKKK